MRKRHESTLRAAFRAGRDEAPEVTSMSVDASGLTWDTADFDEVWSAEHDEKTRAAYEALRLLHGDAFTVTARKVGR